MVLPAVLLLVVSYVFKLACTSLVKFNKNTFQNKLIIKKEAFTENSGDLTFFPKKLLQDKCITGQYFINHISKSYLN